MQRAAASDFESFRDQARALLARGARPEEVLWQDANGAQGSLFEPLAAELEAHDARAQSHAPRVPRRFVEQAELAALHRSPDRFALLYRVLFRLGHGEPRLLDDELDADVRALRERAQAVRKDEHRMHAFVRFRRVEDAGGERMVAWYEPEHLVLRLAAPFFQRRFAAMRWSILTPDEVASWDGETLHFGPGVPRVHAPREDELEALFRAYYRATFNPARVNLPLFRQHVPAAFQRNLPELFAMPEVLNKQVTPKKRKTAAVEETAAPLVPEQRNLRVLREAAAACLACELGPPATQTVFGEGASKAAMCIIGEQPGDEEDLSGRPFVGPAGRLLDRALAEAGIDRKALYVTNAVKHFSYRPVGKKKRLHQKPSAHAVKACHPWLLAELETVRPEVIVCMGATAAQSFMGSRFSITQNFGRVFETPWAKHFLVTYHPSALLRMPDEEARKEARAQFVADLRRGWELASGAKR